MDKAIRDRYSDAIRQEAMSRYAVAGGEITPLDGFESYIYRFSYRGVPAILRITHSLRRSPALIHGEVDWINYLAAGGATVARALFSARGELVEAIDDGVGGQFLATAFAHAPGRPARMDDLTPTGRRAYGRLIGRMHALTKEYAPTSPAWRRPVWIDQTAEEVAALLPPDDAVIRARYESLAAEAALLPRDRDGFGLVHFDAHGGNLFLDGDTVTLFDFDDCAYNWFAADIAIVLFYVIINTADPAAVAAAFLPDFLSGYRQQNRLDPRWLASVPIFMTMREIDLYAVIRRSYDMTTATPEAVEAIPHAWPRQFMRDRRARLLGGVPCVAFDFTTLAGLV